MVSDNLQVDAPDRLTWRDGTFTCALGRSGISTDKREGDGATPVGRFALRRVMYRPDRLEAPVTALPLHPLAPDDGWCDDPAHAAYNRPVKRPFSASHEALWRDDGLYDVIVELGYNDDPVVVGKGSAIFMHVAQPDFAPTEGCVALSRENLLSILAACAAETWITVNPQP